MPLDKLTLTATHNSFTHDRDLLTHSNFEVTARARGVCLYFAVVGYVAAAAADAYDGTWQSFMVSNLAGRKLFSHRAPNVPQARGNMSRGMFEC